MAITLPYTFANGTAADADEVNANLQALAVAVNSTGDTMTGTLSSRSVIPTANNTYDLGSASLAFRNIYVSGSILGHGAPQNTFSTIAVSGQSDVVADATGDTLTLAAGTGITITTNATTDTVTITNSGSTISGVDNHVARLDGTSALQSSGVIIDDSDNVSGIVNLTTTGNRIRPLGTGITLSSGTNNNVTLSAGEVFVVDATAGTCAIGGLTGGTDGRQVWLVHGTSSGTFAFNAEDGSSTAANRIYGSTTGTVSSGRMVSLIYIGSLSRWVVTTP